MVKINEQATVSKVKEHFKNYLNKYQPATISTSNIKAVDYSNIKVSASTRSDSTASRIIELINYSAWAKCTEKAINECIDQPRQPYKRLLEARLIQGQTMWQVAQRIGYGRSQASVLFNRACLNFADVFLMEQINENVNEILDLHIYQTEKDTA